MRLLLVEDDPALSELIVQGLSEEGYRVDHAADGEEAELFLADRTYAVVLLDRLLPDRRGEDLLAQWRARGLGTPVLFLTALDAVEERVKGLRLGADDYLTKPFAFEELLARIEALARRSSLVGPGGRLRSSDLALDPQQARLEGPGGAWVTLTPREAALLELFLRHPGQVLQRQTLLEQVWSEPWEVSENALEAHVKNLRQKIRQVGSSARLRAVRGVGYTLEEGAA
ncbi:response regulator transcription factor [Limnochorda pilosa]|uniref:Transcriptional regulator n=1 Tax=Limnochorda pilosa TaxID=1555112 RepID=A0A0K2SLQ8_LIMPI|nr:response regulator transcription factor [Limnochorda pilosa]BAS27754.1 transcriptional regulator [Limnochorda pilosa]